MHASACPASMRLVWKSTMPCRRLRKSRAPHQRARGRGGNARRGLPPSLALQRLRVPRRTTVVLCLRRLLKCTSRYPSRRCASSATSRYRRTATESRSQRRRRAAATASGFASSMPPTRGCCPVPRIPCRSPCLRAGLPTVDPSSLPQMAIETVDETGEPP